MLSPYVLLVNARNRITKLENWTTGTLARRPAPDRSKGALTSACNPDATRWCALGAIAAEAGMNTFDQTELLGAADTHPSLKEAINALNEACPYFGASLSDWAADVAIAGRVWRTNDKLGHEAILAAFDFAIDNMKGR